MFGKPKLIIVSLSAVFVLYGLVGGLMDGVSAKDDAYRGLRIFTDVLNKVSTDYVEVPDLDKALRGGVHAMMESLDPYSSYVEKDVYAAMKDLEEESSAWPGIVLAKRYGYAHVVSVVQGGPAASKGMRSGDLLESIQGRPTSEMSLWEARKLLLGNEGTEVILSVIRFRRTAASEVRLTREKLDWPEVGARVVEKGVGYLSIPHFQEGVAKQVSTKLKMLQAAGMVGLIVDLRGNAKGLLEEAVKSSDFFLEKKQKILTVADREGTQTAIFSLTDPLVSNIRMVVLIDSGSSGPAEVFAAALTDHDLADTVGQTTDGQGSTKELHTLGDGSVLELLTKRFIRPNGTLIQSRQQRESGLKPGVISPDPEFVSNFYFDNVSGEDETDLEDGFYRRLNQAVREAQFEEALRQIRRAVLEEAA